MFLFCIHDWKKTEEPKFLHFNIDTGAKVFGTKYQCKKCGKKKTRKFEGPILNSLRR